MCRHVRGFNGRHFLEVVVDSFVSVRVVGRLRLMVGEMFVFVAFLS